MAWHCEPCGAVVCAECTDGVADDTIHSGGNNHAAATTEIANETLLAALRQLPEAFPGQPVLWIPRRCKLAAAEVLRSLLTSATDHASAAQGNEEAEIAHRLLRASGQILFRPMARNGEGDRTDEDAEEAPGTCQTIQERLHRAACGKWLELVQECKQDVDLTLSARTNTQREAVGAVQAELTDAKLRAAVVKSRSGSDRGASQILMGGPPVPAGEETDAKVKAQFRTDRLSPAEADELHDALASARRITRRIHISSLHASRSVARLRLASGPGPSGFRNSFIAVINSHPNGAQDLAKWACIWAQATISPWLADMWTGALVRPFFKANGVDVRPILCAEALLKFAVGTAVRRVDNQLATAMGDRQFGAGRRGGAALEIGELRAASKLNPEHAFVSLDIKNAFGSVEWKDALRTVTAAVPKLAPLLAIQWQACQIRLWLRDANGIGWHAFVICGSLLQGGLDGHPVFCLVIGVVVTKISTHSEIVHHWRTMKVWVYVDDVVLQCPQDKVATLTVVITSTLAAFSMVLQPSKCYLHVPQLAAVSTDSWPHHLLQLQGSWHLAQEGLTVLGTEAAGDLSTPFGSAMRAAEHTSARTQRACALADAAMQLVHRPPATGGKQVAYRILRNIVSHALDYDARVLPSSLVLPYARQVEEHCWNGLEAILGCSLMGAERVQVELPTTYAGLQMPMPTTMVPLARAAGLIEVGPALRHTLTANWGCDSGTAQALDEVDDAVNQGILTQLLDQGIALGPEGAPLREPPAAPQNASVMRPPTPQRNLLSRMLQFIAKSKFDALMATAGDRSRTRLQSASGPNAGKSLTAPAGLQQAHYRDDHFTAVLQWRLGIAVPLPVRRCMNMKADGDLCEECLDPEGDHAASCPCGPLRIQRHNAYADGLADNLLETGAHVRREAWIQELATDDADAVLDIWAFGSSDIADVLVDVTIRHPMSATYQPSASHNIATAATAGERSKFARYPAAHGRAVTPFAIETWGRLGKHAEELLQKMVAAATRRNMMRGHAASPGSILKRWRAALDAILQRGMAMSLLSARYGLPGKQHRRLW